METQTRKRIGPPRLIKAVVDRLIPANCREASGDWSQMYVSPSQYLRNAARSLPLMVAEQVRRTSTWWSIAVQGVLLYIAFLGSPLPPLIIIVCAAVFASVLRDAYIHPDRRSPADAAAHAIVASTFVFVTQIILGIAAPSLTLSKALLMRGAAVTLVAMAAWRVVFLLKTTKASPPKKPHHTAKSISRVNLLWLVACFIAVGTNAQAVPAVSPARDFWLVIIPMVLFGLIRRFRINVLDNSPQHALHLSPHGRTSELRANQGVLWQSEWKWLTAFLILFPIPECIAGWRWSQDPATSLVNWTAMWTNCAVLVGLSLIGIALKNLNHNAAQAIEAEIDGIHRER